MAELLPGLRLDPERVPKGRLRLEIGFGGGEHLAHQADLHRDVMFIGAEPFVNGVAKLLALIEAGDLRNILIHDGDAREVLAALPAGGVECIYLLYPDPWPKARHQRRRFVNAETLADFHRLLPPGGEFRFASDIADYVDWTRAAVAEHGGFTETGDPLAAFPGWIETRYEAKAKREGRDSRYLTLLRTG